MRSTTLLTCAGAMALASLSFAACGGGADDSGDGAGAAGADAAAGTRDGASDAPSSPGDAGAQDASKSGDDAGAGFCVSFPSLPGVKPTRSNTGVPSGTVLTPGGSMTISVAGTIVDARDITGDVVIAANDVTIRNSKIHSPGDANAKAVIVQSGVTGTRILHSEIYTDNGGYVGVQADDTIVCGCYLHGWENALTVGGGMTIQANAIERLKGGQAGAHHDGIEVYGGGAPTRIWGNDIRMTDPADAWLGETGAVNVTAYAGDIDDVTIHGNWLGGGSYTLYVDEQNGDQATNVKITGNRFYRMTAAYGTHLIRDGGSVTTWTGNVFDDDGAAIAK